MKLWVVEPAHPGRMVLSRISALACACAGLGWLPGCGETPPSPKMPAAAVTVAQPVQRTVPVYGSYVGSVESPQTVELRARVSGFLKEICFAEGGEVKKGDLMFVIDPAQYEVAVKQALAQQLTAEAGLAQARNVRDVEVDKANLAKAEATLANARQIAKDTEVAYRANAVPREQLNTAHTNMKEEESSVEAAKATLAQSEADFHTRVSQAEAQVATARATVAQAELNLGYTRIYSPLNGRVGRASEKIGALVGQNEPTLLATVSLVSPVYVTFSMSEREAFSLRSMKGEGLRREEASLSVRIALEDGKLYPQEGRLNFVDRALDAGTGTLMLRAEFANPDGFLRPGNYAKVRMLLEERKDALLVTERAVSRDQAGKFLLVVNAQNKVERRDIRTGAHADGGLVVVDAGLKVGDRVVVKGLQRTRPGADVNPAEEAMALAAPPADEQAGMAEAPAKKDAR